MKHSSDPFFLVVASDVRSRLYLGHFNIHLASYTPQRSHTKNPPNSSFQPAQPTFRRRL